MFQNGFRGGISFVMGGQFIYSDDNNKLLHVDQNNLYGWAMMQMLPTGNSKVCDDLSDGSIDMVPSTGDESKTGYVLVVDLKYLKNVTEKSEHFPFCPESKTINSDNFRKCMNEKRPHSFKPTEKPICDQTDKTH